MPRRRAPDDRPPLPAYRKRHSPPVRANGWTETKRTQFLQALRCGCTVKKACALAQMSRVSAYELRRRDQDFADDWEAMIIRDFIDVETIAYERAVNGYDRPVWYKGKQVGWERHYPEELLLGVLKLRIHKRYAEPIPAHRVREMDDERRESWLDGLRRRLEARREDETTAER